MMLDLQDRELVRRVGPATPMGELFRRYWHPVLLSGDLSECDGRPVPVTVLAEDLVAFRDSQGRVGLVEEACPHRGLPLSNGINARGRLTCIYHGWAFDVAGRCVDDLPDADQWRVKAYPTVESAGMIWAYLGPPDKQPPPPSFVFNRLRAEQIVATRSLVRRNYFAVIEERIAAVYRRATPRDDGIDIARHVLPGLTIVTAMESDGSATLTVPVDVWSSLRFTVRFRLDRAFTVGEREAIAGRSAEAAGDRPAFQDHGSAEAGLNPAGTAIARVRQMLAARARDLQEGIDPPPANANDAPFCLRG